MELYFKLLFLCPLLFIAGIIDGISGGGGIIALPAYLMAGLPINIAYGCNKMQSCIGTSASLFKYAKNGLVDMKASFVSSITAVIGSYISTQIMLSLDDRIKNVIIIAAMCFIITLTLLTAKITAGEQNKIALSRQNVLLCLAVGLLLGLYDGFFGPGGGTIALMLFSIIFRYDIRTATGNGKVIIVISNLIALVNYIINGSVLYEIAIPATIANIIGSCLGASLAIKNGRGLVKKFLMAVVCIVVVQAGIKLL